jgi:hypothetical protein
MKLVIHIFECVLLSLGNAVPSNNTVSVRDSDLHSLALRNLPSSVSVHNFWDSLYIGIIEIRLTV